MYGMPGVPYGGGGVCIHSFTDLTREIKVRQAAHPSSKFFIRQKGIDIEVKVLQNDYIELDGAVQSRSYESLIESSMKTGSVYLLERAE
jgi:hypothetical protein